MCIYARSFPYRAGMLAALILPLLLGALLLPACAPAAELPAWKILSVSTPTNLPPGAGGEVIVTAVNVGGGATDGSQITIADVLPSRLTSTGIRGVDIYTFGSVVGGEKSRVQLECALAALACTRSAPVEPGDQLVVRISVNVQSGPSASVLNSATVSGGGAQSGASASSPLTLSASPAPPGLVPGSVFAATSSHEAGGHPDGTAGFTLSTLGPEAVVADPREVRFDLSPGLVGNTVGMPRCTVGLILLANLCPSDTVVGVASASITGGPAGEGTGVAPVFNIAPAPGEPAAFAFRVNQFPVRLDTTLLSDGDYGVRVSAGNLSQSEPVISSYVTLWGVPADHQAPGKITLEPAAPGGVSSLGGRSSNTRVPLLSNPTQCSTPLTATAQVASWREPSIFSEQTVSAGTMEDCGLLPFSGSVSMLPDTLQAGAPAGYTFDLHVPQTSEPDGPATADVKRVVTTLPMGTVISPSAAQGLQACSDEQFFGPESERGLERPATPGNCPREAQVGTVQIKTPALEETLVGDVYLASPLCNPCTPQDAQDGRMVRLFLQVVSEGEGGIVVKQELIGHVNQQTGQLSIVDEQAPPVPFSDLKLILGGGPRATLANPRTCGPTATTVQLTPWSTPFTADVSAVSPLEINQGCIGTQFQPSFAAGTTGIQAGEYTPFTVAFGRQDQDGFLNGIQIHMPPGLLGSLAHVPLCPEPQAAEGTCGPESLIGHTQVLTGPGANPFLVTGGQVYLTQGYKGAPFGLSIVVPAVAGPYTLSGTTGRGTVVVRAAINIDPTTAALTVTSDSLPTALDGIPLQLKVVNVTIDRPGFTFNPTNCSRLAIEASISSRESAAVSTAVPFQATNCRGLAFKPKFTVATTGKTSKARGASLDAKVTFPPGSQGTQSNIAYVKVELPRQLPSQLKTLQKACTAAQFSADPAGCPSASIVGTVRASTPVLPTPLSGPVYFVSHGGAAFPDLEIVLQGDGVRVDLTGQTFISKQGVTSTTFRTVPDVPINSFELYLPQGTYAALAAIGNLCTSKGKLVMPVHFIAQNGAELRQSTHIAVTGCAKPKKAKKARGARAQRAREADRQRRANHGGRA